MSETYSKLVKYVSEQFRGCEDRFIGSEETLRSAVLVPFVCIDGVESILFEKRAAGIRQAGEICFPGGMIDDEDCSSIETVVRETIEETGIAADAIQVHESAGYLLTGIGSLIDVYLGRIDTHSMDEFSPNPAEVERLFAIPVDYFLNTPPEYYHYRHISAPWYEDDEGNRVDLFPSKELGLPKRYWNPWHHDKNRFVVYQYDGEVIWGITARIMNTVTKLLRKTGL